ncbi:hypothetical protein [Streptomyces sp. NBC_00122]|uniref:hypothetical protein n=1 Tax=Streptomyces sp. NBC_00122 TaxID=2903623 RepID=UPI00324D190F
MLPFPDRIDAAQVCAAAPQGLRETVETVLTQAAPEFVGGLMVVVLVAAVDWAVRGAGRHRK